MLLSSGFKALIYQDINFTRKRHTLLFVLTIDTGIFGSEAPAYQDILQDGDPINKRSMCVPLSTSNIYVHLPQTHSRNCSSLDFAHAIIQK